MSFVGTMKSTGVFASRALIASLHDPQYDFGSPSTFSAM
jgi:hypothetical protein